MARFFGRFEHTLDEKGRLTLPAKFRGAFERGGYLTQGGGGCLTLWAPEEFERQMEAMATRAGQGPAERDLVRLWAANSADVVPDRQGRISLPSYLRSFAGLGLEVLVHGAIDRIELWDPGRWRSRVAPAETRLAEGGEWW